MNSTTKFIVTSKNVSIAKINSTTNDVVLFKNVLSMLLFDYDFVYIDNAMKNFAQWLEKVNIVFKFLRKFINIQND